MRKMYTVVNGTFTAPLMFLSYFYGLRSRSDYEGGTPQKRSIVIHRFLSIFLVLHAVPRRSHDNCILHEGKRLSIDERSIVLHVHVILGSSQHARARITDSVAGNPARSGLTSK